MHADGFAGASSPACRASSELALRLSGRRRVLVHSPGPRDLCIVCSCSEYILVIVEVLAPPILYIYRKTNRRLFTLPLGYNRRCVFVQMCLCVLLSFSRYSCGTDMVEIAPVIDDDQSKTFLDAQGFVSAGGGVNPKLAKLSWDKSGISQFHTLLRAGLRRSHQFLEFGCGTLNLARYLVPFLNVGNYVCVEPNEWLVQSSLQRGEEVPGGEDLLFTMLRRKAEFIHRYDFNGSSGDRKYDFIFLHSVLSHASVSQLSQFMKVTKELLSPGGLSLASLCFCFPCEDEESRLEYEKSGRKDAAFMDQCEESYDTEWVYPYVSWWNPGRLRSLGLSSGIDVAWRNDIRKYMMSRNPLDSHDWIALRRTANRPL